MTRTGGRRKQTGQADGVRREELQMLRRLGKTLFNENLGGSIFLESSNPLKLLLLLTNNNI
jgi:hypothetical protein